MKDVLMQRSEKGEIAIYDRRDKFLASFKNGQWIGDDVFNFYELEEFTVLYDDNEIVQVLAEARAALNQPLVMQADNQAKSA
ncbi:MAG: hypothetical protein C0469_03450 [Cyanobacteria bacterium DS2.3.42]|nr:hypothetical protein [Cyanobacteria bacterium DS2.3.42]